MTKSVQMHLKLNHCKNGNDIINNLVNQGRKNMQQMKSKRFFKAVDSTPQVL